MAGVYIARAQGVAGFERLFAVKILHPHLAHEEEFITMFLDEARLAARIRHPNVVSTIDISDTQDAGYYLVMDYIEGDHLGALMRQAGQAEERIPIPDTFRIIVDALSGLGAAHELTDEAGQPIRLVHRDISPQNILVGTDGISRITDFGVAKAETRLTTTREGEFKGKLAYMAPEHVSEGHSDQRSDLFAMGIVLWECLTGHRLFRAENQAATLNKVCLEPIPLASSKDPALAPLDAMVDKALQRNPDLRFQSAMEFIEAIEKCASQHGGLGSRRTVGGLVKNYAAEKLARERELIRSAIAGLSSGEIVAAVPLTSEAPPPVQTSYVQTISSTPPTTVSGERAVDPRLVPVEAPAVSPDALLERPTYLAQKSHKAAWIIGGLGIAVAGAAAVLGFLYFGRVHTAQTDRPLTDGRVIAPPAVSSDLTRPPPPQPALQPPSKLPQPVSPTPPTAKSVDSKQPRNSEDTKAQPVEEKSDLNEKALVEPRRDKRARRHVEKPALTPAAAPTQKAPPALVQETPPAVHVTPKASPPKHGREDEIIRNPYR
jgi:serine/threonine-protein kinase